MAKKTADEDLIAGDRVRCLEMPVKGHTGTVVRRGRILHLKVWVVQLDKTSGRGGGVVRIRKLEKLTSDEDPKPLQA